MNTSGRSGRGSLFLASDPVSNSPTLFSSPLRVVAMTSKAVVVDVLLVYYCYYSYLSLSGSRFDSIRGLLVLAMNLAIRKWALFIEYRTY